MRTNSELNWLQAAFDAFEGEVGDPILSFVLEGYSPSFTITSDVGAGTVSEVSMIDAVVAGDVIVRAWPDANTIYIETLASEDAADLPWAQQTLTATGINPLINVSLVASGNTVRVFYYDDTNIKYFESPDKGTSWGAATIATAVNDLKFMGATSLTRVHWMRLTSKNNLLLGLSEDDGGWSSTDSYVYWPFMPGSFDAITSIQEDDGAAASSDIIAFTSDLPPLIGVRVDGTEVVHKVERVQGVIVFRYQNGRWSDHWEFDVVDNVVNSPERTNLRLSSYGGWLFMTYLRRGGPENYPYTHLAVSRSRSGIHWELPYILDTTSIGTYCILLKRGDHLYLVDSSGRKIRSMSCGYVGDAKTTHDLTDYVLSIDMRSEDIKELQISLASPAGALDDILDTDTLWQARITQGYYLEASELEVQTVLADIDSISRIRQAPMGTDHRVLTGRNALGRMVSLQADNIQELESQQSGGDNFQSTDGTDYSGLRHTATYQGFWTAESNVLKLKQSESVGIAFNTYCDYAWNGSCQSGIMVAASDTNDFAGLVFRAYDKYYFWHAVYDADQDAIVLSYRDNGTDSHKAHASNMGWSISTWYYLKVKFWYNRISVFSSTDGIAWTRKIYYEADGVAEGTTFNLTNVPVMQGKMGYVGHGYSEDDTGYVSIPPEPPSSPPDIDEYWPTCVGVITNNAIAVTSGVYFCEDFTGADEPDVQPTWEDKSSNLPYNGIQAAGCDPVDPLNRWYIQLDYDHGTEPGSIYFSPDQGDSWEKIFGIDDPVCEGAGPNIGGESVLWDMVVDKTTGNVYTIQDRGPLDDAYVYKYVYDTDTWTKMDPGVVSCAFVGDIDAWGDRVAFAWLPATGKWRLVRYDGSSWGQAGTDDPGDGSVVSAQPMGISPNDEYYYWTVYNNGTSKFRWVKGSVGGASSEIVWPGAVYPVPGRKDRLWFYPDVGGHVRMVYTGSWPGAQESQMGISDDHFATTTVYSLGNGTKNLYNVNSILHITRDSQPGWATFGSSGYTTLNESVSLTATPHCILVADLFSSYTTLYGKAGGMCATSPYTDSIPRISGGPVKNGILFCD